MLGGGSGEQGSAMLYGWAGWEMRVIRTGTVVYLIAIEAQHEDKKLDLYRSKSAISGEAGRLSTQSSHTTSCHAYAWVGT